MPVDDSFILERFDEALEGGRIRAHFQPILRTLTERVCCAEALARWDDAQLGLLSPADFIPVLERHGLIYRLDLAILRDACAMYRRLQASPTPVHSFSVNFSRLDFDRPDFFRAVCDTLAAHGVPHEAIKLEVTESTLFADRQRFDEVFNTFQGAGFKIWIDDFGSGYSSLGLLTEYDFDLLKIDMSFLRSFTHKSRQLISSIVITAKALGILTLIEGVETEAQLGFLRAIGCESIQGFYYARPMAAGDFADWLSQSRVEPAEEREYWNAVGNFDLLSPNPLDAQGRQSDIPLALIECTWGRGDYVFANKAYLSSVRALGFDSIADLERFFNDKLSPRYNPMRSLLTDAVMKQTVQEMDYVSGDVFYKFRAKCIAKSKALNKAMVAATLSTFTEDAEAMQRSELRQYSQSIFASYEHVTLCFPEKDVSVRVFSRANFQTAHQLMGLREGVRSFCEKEVHPDDRARYLRFFDVDTLARRLGEAGFIQQGFRVTDLAGGYAWRQVRITRIPSAVEDMYLYTLQTMSDVSVRIAEMLLREHPELME